MRGLPSWAGESIQHCGKESLLLYLSEHEDAHGLLAPRARPAIASKWLTRADNANRAVEKMLTEELRGDPASQEDPPGSNAVDAAVVSLDELSVTTLSTGG